MKKNSPIIFFYLSKISMKKNSPIIFCFYLSKISMKKNSPIIFCFYLSKISMKKNSPIIFSFYLNNFLVKICSIFNDFSIIGQNIMKPMKYTFTRQGLFKIPKAQREHHGLGDFNAINKTNKQPFFS
jgi:monomeric isocitrate dehydrogenase